MGGRKQFLIRMAASYFHLLLFVSLAVAGASAEVAAEAKQRNPKLFFVSSTTSTVSTTTVCYLSSTAAAACGKRKRRALMVDSVSGEDTAIDFSGSPGLRRKRALLKWRA